MWTLVLITMVVQSSAGGGVATDTAYLDFPNQTKCEAAANVVGVPPSSSIPGSGSTSVAHYRVVAKCVQR